GDPPRGRPPPQTRPVRAARSRDRRSRPGRAPGSVLRRAGGNAPGARGRDHRLDLRPGEVGLAATRSRRAAAQRDEPPGRARHGRERGTGLVEAHVEAHHGPPLAHQSSRVNASVLGMLLFIASEVMLFGSFFTAYFFVRVANGIPWPTPPFHLPVFVAGINTAILVTSSFTMHWSLPSTKSGNR